MRDPLVEHGFRDRFSSFFRTKGHVTRFKKLAVAKPWKKLISAETLRHLNPNPDEAQSRRVINMRCSWKPWIVGLESKIFSRSIIRRTTLAHSS